jgi:hypothetical protein
VIKKILQLSDTNKDAMPHNVTILSVLTIPQIQSFAISVRCPNILYLQGASHFFDIIYVSWVETVTCLKIFKRFLNLPFVSQNEALKDKMMKCNYK